jgi:hypothetical protein
VGTPTLESSKSSLLWITVEQRTRLVFDLQAMPDKCRCLLPGTLRALSTDPERYMISSIHSLQQIVQLLNGSESTESILKVLHAYYEWSLPICKHRSCSPIQRRKKCCLAYDSTYTAGIALIPTVHYHWYRTQGSVCSSNIQTIWATLLGLDAMEPVEKEDHVQPTGCKHPLPSIKVHKEGESLKCQ